MLLLVVVIGCKSEQELSHRDLRLNSFQIGDYDKGTAIYDGVKHEYLLELPEEYEGAPLIVMLPGYGDSAEKMKAQTALDEDACVLGYAVVYVNGAPNPNDSTSSMGWNSGVGESGNKDVEFLCALVNDLCITYSFDPNRVYAVGFSNGAFMTHRLALEANDIFSAVVSVSGMMPASIWDERTPDNKVSIFQITGGQDDVIPQNSNGSSEFSKDPAIEDVMDFYIDSNSVDLADNRKIGINGDLKIFDSPDSNNQVWNLYIPDGVHSWPDERYTGINVNELILEFLGTQSGLTIVYKEEKPAISTPTPTPTPMEVVSLGNYEGQPIEWMVIDETDDKMLMISSEAICTMAYSEERVDITWEECDLRQWLNGEFYDTAFSSEEKSRIQSTDVGADFNPYYDTDPGNDTVDKVFLLSVVEAEQFFDTDNARICNYNDEPCWWWLRSPGYGQHRASMVCIDGTIGKSYGYFVDSTFQGVRPVMWVSK
ncbi:MAG: DUF6273 domain-containing protein [Saccharofermentans sp.]|nr:DUF6273 domain-containing protein [Saccharofermentans sp.]